MENLRRRPVHHRVQTKPFTAEDIRFTQPKNGKALYATVLAIPADGKVTIKSLASNSQYWMGNVGCVKLVQGDRWLGDQTLKFTRDENGLHVSLPKNFNGKTAFALKIQP